MNLNGLLNISFFPLEIHKDEMFSEDFIEKDYSITFYKPKNGKKTQYYIHPTSSLNNFISDLKLTQDLSISYKDITQKCLYDIMENYVLKQKSIFIFKDDDIQITELGIKINRPKELENLFLDKPINAYEFIEMIEQIIYAKYNLKNVRNRIILNLKNIKVESEFNKIKSNFAKTNNIYDMLNEIKFLNSEITNYFDFFVIE